MTEDVLVVHGGTPLQGQIRVRGAKNLVSKAMVAALLGESPSSAATIALETRFLAPRTRICPRNGEPPCTTRTSLVNAASTGKVCS